LKLARIVNCDIRKIITKRYARLWRAVQEAIDSTQARQRRAYREKPMTDGVKSRRDFLKTSALGAAGLRV
jgi:hypothetical protein